MSMRIGMVLVANRGEIASRVFRTCREMGIRTVAVYSDDDGDAPFVREADLAVRLPGARSADTYLRADLILEAARRTGADAIHPGYGFLSENSAFARACASAGLTFIGPSAYAIDVMGDKLRSKELMAAAGVPVLPGVTIGDEIGADIFDAVEAMGYPVLVKASAGGGGRGMRVVEHGDDLVSAVESARREAGAAFGDDTVFIEKYVVEPRHIEVQVMADGHDNVVSLFERECSIQRRHQKVIEESPSVAVDDRLRARLCAAAVAAARAVDYRGAGTVEFVLAPDGEFAFLEMNTRLQVEHPVTEMVTGLDLVRLQIDVASGRPLPADALEPRLHGHAIEARLYAEDVPAGYLPTTGTVTAFGLRDVPGLRVDSTVESGSVVSPHYDPMLAKVIAWAPSRDAAAQLLATSLRGARIAGLTTNLELLVRVLEDEDFRSGTFSTAFLHEKNFVASPPLVPPDLFGVYAVAAALIDCAERRARAAVQPTIPSGWRNNPSSGQVRRYRYGDVELCISYTFVDATTVSLVTGEGNPQIVHVHALTSTSVDLVVDGVRRRFDVVRGTGEETVFSYVGALALQHVDRFPKSESALTHGALTAPMPGSVLKVLADVGDEVEPGSPFAVLEAMKMEHTVVVPAAGHVVEILVAVGDQVDAGAVLARIEPVGQGDDPPPHIRSTQYTDTRGHAPRERNTAHV
jgi:acetyl/propionyl-CoA carboxylase alpha subunit